VGCDGCVYDLIFPLPGIILLFVTALLILTLLLWTSPAVGQTKPKPATVYAGELLRVVDGDTLRVRIETTPDHYWTPSIRLLNVDTPELKGKCENERGMARMAKDLVGMRLPPASIVSVMSLKPDKFAGRYDATVLTSEGESLAAILIDAGLARKYDGGKRGGWC